MKEPNRIPITIPESIDLLYESVEEEDRAYIHEHEAITAHHSFGQAIRNIWKLWDSESPLVVDFKNRFQLFGHADDISSIILTAFWARVRGENEEEAVEKELEFLKKHWTDSNIDLITGEQK